MSSDGNLKPAEAEGLAEGLAGDAETSLHGHESVNRLKAFDAS